MSKRFDNIKENIRKLIINYGLKDCSNTELVLAYWLSFDKGLGDKLKELLKEVVVEEFTPIESITRAKRKLVEEARLWNCKHPTDPWPYKVLPNNYRLGVIESEEQKYREGMLN